MVRHGIAPASPPRRRGWLALAAGLPLASAAAAQVGPGHVPPIQQQPMRLDAVLVEWAGPGAEGEDAVASLVERLADDDALPDEVRVVASVSGHAVRSYRHRLARDEQPDLLLTAVGRDGRYVRALLEIEGAPADEALVLRVRLERSRGPTRGRHVEALGPRGPWLRIDLHRP